MWQALHNQPVLGLLLLPTGGKAAGNPPAQGIPLIRTLQEVTAQQLLEFRPVPPLPSIIRCCIVPSPFFSSQFQCDGGAVLTCMALSWSLAGLELQHYFSPDARPCLTLLSLHDLELLPAVFAFL